jgi:hypothetical protein
MTRRHRNWASLVDFPTFNSISGTIEFQPIFNEIARDNNNYYYYSPDSQKIFEQIEA